MSGNKNLIKFGTGNSKSIEDYIENEPTVAPLTDIIELKNEYLIIVNLAGSKREDIKLKIAGNCLIVFAKSDMNYYWKNNLILNENPVGHFYRKFNLSSDINTSLIQAKYENGQLVIKLPKFEKPKPKIINID